MPAKLARTFLKLIGQRAGAPAPAIHWEIFPNCDKLRGNAFGPLIKLPLGVHKRSGRRCVFLDSQGQPLGDVGAVLEHVHRNTKEAIEALILAHGAPASTATKDNLGEAPLVHRLLDGCAIVHGLVEKAKATHYLNHQERLTLLYTLGHLGDEGRKYLHQVIGYTINYDYDITESYIRKMKPYPISCPKVKERHAELAVNSACDCHFKLPKGGYPSPTLHAFRSLPKVWPPPNPQPRAGRLPSQEKAARGVSALPSSGKAEVSRGDDASRPVNQGDRDSYRSAQEELNATLKKYIELKRHLRGVEKSLQRIEAELAAIFDRAGTDRLETELGVLIRRKEKDKTEWIIDL